MRTQVFALVLLTSFATPVLASSLAAEESTLDATTCPMVTDDAQLLLTTIQTLKDQIRQLPECQPIADKLNVINKVLANNKWKDVKNAITREGSVSLEGSDVNTITQLTTEATAALTETIGMVSGNFANCVPAANKPSFLGTLSGVTREVSGIIGNMTGPYKQAVSLVGNLVSSAISGVDSIFKRGKLYNFANPAEEMLFLNQFCAFTESQKNVDGYLRLKQIPGELKGMMRYLLDGKVKDLVENCPECAAYKKAWDAKEASDRIVKRIIEDANIIDIPRGGLPYTFTRCAEIQRAFYSEESDFSQLINLLKGYENPMMSSNDRTVIAEITNATNKMQEIYPRYSTCIASSNQEISIKFNDFMRDDIIRLPETIFNQQLAAFKRIANNSYVSRQNGDYMASSLERIKWGNEEVIRIERKANEPNYLMSTQVVLKQQKELRQRLLTNLMPSYLRYRFRTNRQDTRRFMTSFESFKKRELAHFSKRLSKQFANLTELTAALRENPEAASYFVSSYEKVFTDHRLVMVEVANNARFCKYLLHARSMTPANRAVCDFRSQEIAELQSEFKNFGGDIEVIKEFNTWAEDNLAIQSSPVREYAELIRDWNAQGDARWERVQP